MLLFGIRSLSRNHLYNHEINNYVFLATFFHVSRDKVEYTNLEPLIGAGVYKVPSSGYHVFRTVPNFLPISRSHRKSGEGISEFFIKNFKNFISKLKILGS